jgi:hypothetical protein
MANVTSIRTATFKSNDATPQVMIIAGALGTVFCAFGVFASLFAAQWRGATYFGIAALVALVVPGLGWLGAHRKPLHFVSLGSAGGETHALSTDNEELAAAVVKALNVAIASRG